MAELMAQMKSGSEADDEEEDEGVDRMDGDVDEALAACIGITDPITHPV